MSDEQTRNLPPRGSAEYEEAAFSDFNNRYGHLSEKEQTRIYFEQVQKNIERLKAIMPDSISDVAQRSVDRAILNESVDGMI